MYRHRYSPPTGGIGGAIFTVFWLYWLGQIINSFVGKRHPGFLSGFYWTLGSIFALMYLAVFVWWIVEKIRKPAVENAQQYAKASESPTTPACPKCGGTMRERLAKKGRHSGNKFWGCANYPRCKGIRDIATTSETEQWDEQALG
jgi:Topoisomerase DNA binding C4 zinc finger